MKQSLLILNRMQRCHFHGRDRCQTGLGGYAHLQSSQRAAVCVCFPAPQFPLLPVPCSAFPNPSFSRRRFLCCRAASPPPPAPRVVPFGFPRSPGWLQGSGNAELCSKPCQCNFCRLPWGWEHRPALQRHRASLSPAIYKLFTNALDRLWQIQQRKGLTIVNTPAKHPQIPAMYWALPSCYNILLQKILPETLFTPFWLPSVR